MASKNFSGILRDPLGTLANNDKYRFTHVSTTGEVIRGSTSYLNIGDNGVYNIDIEYGNVTIESYSELGKRWINQGTTTINADTVATTLPALLNALIPASDALILQLESLLADAESAAGDAAASAVIANAAAADAFGSFSLEAASGGKNKIFVDAQGNQNVMVWIPKFNSEDVNAAILARHGVDLQLGTGVFPAFIKNGVQISGFWYAKYQASAGQNGGCSVVSPALPRTSVNYDAAKALCTNKGAGWHLAANIEWLAVSFLGLAFGDQPRGNTNYGRAHDAKHEVMKLSDSAFAPGDTALPSAGYTGTGPSQWSHDGTQFGVFDMVGNVWEWVDQLKLQEGQIFAPLDNNPDMPEGDWPAHECYFDSSGATSGNVILNSLITNRTGDLGDNGSGNGSNSNTWRTTAKGPSYVENLLMRQMGIEPPAGALFNGTLYSRNFGERLPYRGGTWYSTSGAGLGALGFGYARTNARSDIGFRPALFES